MQKTIMKRTSTSPALIFLLAAVAATCILQSTVAAPVSVNVQESLPVTFLIHSPSSGLYVQMHSNGSIDALATPRNLNARWTFHHTHGAVYRIESAEFRDHYLVWAEHGELAVLRGHNQNNPLLLRDIVQQTTESGSASSNSGEMEPTEDPDTVIIPEYSWIVGSSESIVSSLRTHSDCYLAFGEDGYPRMDFCGVSSTNKTVELVFVPTYLF